MQCDVATCACLGRIAKCLHFYQVLDANNKNALLSYLSQEQYGGCFLDDWNHILFEHASAEQFELVYERLQILKVLKECQLETCNAFTRNNRDRERENEDEEEEEKLLTSNDELVDESEVQMLSFYIDALDTIHCHLLHSFDCGLRLSRRVFSDEDDEINAELDQDDKKQVGDNDDEWHWDVNFLRDATLQRVIALMTRLAKNRFEGVRGASRSQHNKFMTESIEDDSEEEQKANDNDDDNGQEKQKETQKQTAYSFGVWMSYRSGQPKYQNLEEELVSNTTHTIPLSSFKEVVVNAEQKLTTTHAKKMRYIGVHLNDDKNDSPVTAKHLMAVFLYCNFDKLQYEFSRTFRQIKKEETKDEIKARNREYGIWSQLLFETVNRYGEEIGDSAVKTFYHGIRTKMVFTSFLCVFDSPTSLTAKFEVATTFATNNGVILKLTQDDKDLCYFNTTWLSSYSNEDERLLFQSGGTPIQMITIWCMQTGDNYRLFVHAFSLFAYCLQGEYPPGGQQDQTMLRKTDLAVIREMLMHFDDDVVYKNELPAYANAMFDAWRPNVKSIRINVIRVQQYYSLFVGLLFVDDACLVLQFAKLARVFNDMNWYEIFYYYKDMPNLRVFWKQLLMELAETSKYIKKKLTVNLISVKCDEEVWNEMKSSEWAPCVAGWEKRTGHHQSIKLTLKKAEQY